jgi:hypothetical protein
MGRHGRRHHQHITNTLQLSVAGESGDAESKDAAASADFGVTCGHGSRLNVKQTEWYVQERPRPVEGATQRSSNRLHGDENGLEPIKLHRLSMLGLVLQDQLRGKQRKTAGLNARGSIQQCNCFREKMLLQVGWQL